jgi:predicted adenylyl cyclase CyaB
MKREVEIQMIIKNPREVEKKLRKTGKFIKTRKQVYKYFVPPHKNYFRIDPPVEYIRVRHEKDKNHLNYSFIHFDKKLRLRATDEYETLVENPRTVESIFKRIGLIPKVTVIKTRKFFDCGNFEVVLDRVKGLENFMEVEAKKDFGGIRKTRKACEEFLKSLNVDYEILHLMGYPRLLYRKLKGLKWKK